MAKSPSDSRQSSGGQGWGAGHREGRHGGRRGGGGREEAIRRGAQGTTAGERGTAGRGGGVARGGAGVWRGAEQAVEEGPESRSRPRRLPPCVGGVAQRGAHALNLCTRLQRVLPAGTGHSPSQAPPEVMGRRRPWKQPQGDSAIAWKERESRLVLELSGSGERAFSCPFIQRDTPECPPQAGAGLGLRR